MTPETAIEDFLYHLELHGYSTMSLNSYRYHLGSFARFLEKRGIDEVTAVTPAYLREYQTEMFWRISAYGKPYSMHTHCSRLCVLKKFFRHVSWKCVLMNDPTQYFTARKPDFVPRVVLDPEEVEALLSQPNLKTFAGKRDRAIIEILYSTAVRHRELSELTLLDVNLLDETLSIRRGKGRKDRVVPLGEAASQYLRIYLDACNRVPRDDPSLFLTQDGKKLGYTTYNIKLYWYATRAGIMKHVTCHVLRHTCAVHMLEGGADVRFISELLGHDSLDSTQIYLRVSRSELSKVHRLTHPRGKAKNPGE